MSFFLCIVTLTLLGPQSRFGGKLLIIRVLRPHIWECAAKGVKACLNTPPFWDCSRAKNIGMQTMVAASAVTRKQVCWWLLDQRRVL